jgi:hypothetical protein
MFLLAMSQEKENVHFIFCPSPFHSMNNRTFQTDSGALSPGINLTIHIQLPPKLRMSGSTPPLSTRCAERQICFSSHYFLIQVWFRKFKFFSALLFRGLYRTSLAIKTKVYLWVLIIKSERFITVSHCSEYRRCPDVHLVGGGAIICAEVHKFY